MPRPISQITADLDSFKPPNADWLTLDKLVQELLASDSASSGIDALLGIFERYPSEDGFGVFWALLHGLESLPGYEERLLESILRLPTRFTVLMVNRLLNAGCDEVSGVPLLPLLHRITCDRQAMPEIRQEAQNFVDHHGSQS